MKFVRAVICVVLIVSVILSFPLPAIADPDSAVSVSAKRAILIEAHSADVLYAKNERQRAGMASTTKIMTALVVSEALPCDKLISIPKEAVNIEGSSVYLCEGELLSVEQLLCALMLSSANDAAVALALAVSGSIEAFAEKMNEKALALGLCDTHFTNPHGLYDEDHYTTAFDLALIARAALENKTVRRIASTQKTQIPQGVSSTDPQGLSVRYLQNHNKMLRNYDGAIGLKTGFTKKTGRCLVSAAERDGLCLIAVTLDAPDDWADHTRMLDYGFSAYERVTFFDVGEFTYSFSVCGGNETAVTLTNSEPLTLSLPKGKKSAAKTVVNSYSRFEFAPVYTGDKLASVTLSCDGKSATSDLVAAYTVQRKNKS